MNGTRIYPEKLDIHPRNLANRYQTRINMLGLEHVSPASNMAILGVSILKFGRYIRSQANNFR